MAEPTGFPDDDAVEGHCRGNATVEAYNLGVTAAGRRLLEDVSLTILPSELIGIMGPSGAGKTTLMTALNGYARPTTGAVLINGRDLYADYDAFRTSIGYVPQDDIIHPALTVYQALYFAARLRLSADCPRRDIRLRVSTVVSQLGLKGTEHMLIGSPDQKNCISGGERKRVNLAMELLSDPPLLFLDEPTSGLSAGDTLAVMRLLRDLANSGKTILLTIHQPGHEAFRLLDKLVFIGKEEGGVGNVVYFGPAYPDSIDFFNPGGVPGLRPGAEPPPEAVEQGYRAGCLAHGHKAWVRRYRELICQRDRVDGSARHLGSVVESRVPPKAPHCFAFSQFTTLTKRGVAIKAADRWNTMILLAQAPFIGTLIAAAFGAKVTESDAFAASHSLSITIFLLVLSALWFGCSNSVREIVGESAVYRRERMVGLSIGAYVASKFAVLGALCILQCSALLTLVTWGCELKGALPAMFALLLIVSAVGVALGLIVSALSKTTEVAISLLPLVLLPMVILGGLMMPVHDLPPLVRAITQLMPSRWGFEGLLLLENDGRMPFTSSAHPADQLMVKRDWAEDYFPADNHRYGEAFTVVALVVSLTLLTAGIYTALRTRDTRIKATRESSGIRITGSAAPRVQASTSVPRVPRMRGNSLRFQLAVPLMLLVSIPIVWLSMPPRSTLHSNPQSSTSLASAASNSHSRSLPPKQLMPSAARSPSAYSPLSQGPAAPGRLSENAKARPSLSPTEVAEAAQFYYDRGRSLVEAGHYARALVALDNAIRLKHNFPQALHFRALAHEELGEFQKALDDLNAAIEFEPTAAWAFAARSTVHERLGNYSAALVDAQSAWDLAPDENQYLQQAQRLQQKVGAQKGFERRYPRRRR